MMSELDALSNAPDMVETRMVETGEAVAADGMRIDSTSIARYLTRMAALPHPRPPISLPELMTLLTLASASCPRLL